MNCRRRISFVLLVVALAGTHAPRAAAGDECTPGWHTELGIGNVPGTSLRAATVFDFDADGPEPPMLVVGARNFTNDFAGGNGVSRLNPDGNWEPLGPVMFGLIKSLAVVDLDADGPQGLSLVLGGHIQQITGGNFLYVKGVARWTGTTWEQLGDALQGRPGRFEVDDLAVFDPDADGPAPSRLVASGWTHIEEGPGGLNQSMTEVLEWVNGAWQSPTLKRGGPSDHLVIHDFDADGPFASSLVAVHSGRPHIIVNQNWQLLHPTQFLGTIHAVGSFDLDGPGPLPPTIIAAGEFTQISGGGPAALRIAQWQGDTWGPIGNGFNNTVRSLTLWDIDGPGPGPRRLVASGDFTASGATALPRVAWWDGTTWRPFGPNLNRTLFTLFSYDTDEHGPNPPMLLGAANATGTGGMGDGVMWFDGAIWRPYGTGLGNLVTQLGFFDFDLTGPEPLSLVACGSFNDAGHNRAPGFARWLDGRWQPLTGFNFANCFISFDFGNGPEMVIGGSFNVAPNGVLLSRVARLSQGMWRPIGAGVPSTVNTFGVFQFPDDPPSQPSLLAATDTRIYRWHNGAWAPLGGALTLAPCCAEIHEISQFDLDGDGPEASRLIVAGEFESYVGPVNPVVWWDGAAWRSVGPDPGSPGSLDGIVTCLHVFDFDAEGPLPPRLIAAGSLDAPGKTSANQVAYWDGSAWQNFGNLSYGAGYNRRVRCITSFDADGTGPLPLSLYIGGQYLSPDDVEFQLDEYLMRLEGNEWVHSNFAFNRRDAHDGNVSIEALLAHDSDADPATPDSLYIGGLFRYANDAEVSNLVRWGCPLPSVPDSNCPGDINADSLCNVFDLSVLLAQFGSFTAPGVGADLNADGVVSGFDLFILLSNFGTAC